MKDIKDPTPLPDLAALRNSAASLKALQSWHALNGGAFGPGALLASAMRDSLRKEMRDELARFSSLCWDALAALGGNPGLGMLREERERLRREVLRLRREVQELDLPKGL